MRNRSRALGFAVALAVGALLAADCARPAKSEPLTVTYYYLPG